LRTLKIIKEESQPLSSARKTRNDGVDAQNSANTLGVGALEENFSAGSEFGDEKISDFEGNFHDSNTNSGLNLDHSSYEVPNTGLFKYLKYESRL
jgi:hypothetical protein